MSFILDRSGLSSLQWRSNDSKDTSVCPYYAGKKSHQQSRYSVVHCVSKASIRHMRKMRRLALAQRGAYALALPSYFTSMTETSQHEPTGQILTRKSPAKVRYMTTVTHLSDSDSLSPCLKPTRRNNDALLLR